MPDVKIKTEDQPPAPQAQSADPGVKIFCDDSFDVSELLEMSNPTGASEPIEPLVTATSISGSLKDPLSYGDTSLKSSTWKSCDDLDLFKQVEVRESAVTDAVICLAEVEGTLKKHSPHIRSTGKWLDRIKSIRAGKKECRVLVGFLGVTGAGKSSLINALLESKDILPVDDEQACTAVCVEISWNTSEMPSCQYIAKIDRISREHWKLELERLFKDISDDALNLDGEDGEPDLERDERIKTAFQKLKCVYPHIRSKKDLTALNADILLEHANVRDILGHSKLISSSELESFSAQIKPYIDSSSAKENDEGRSFAQWPLVKLVQLQLKSEILKNGIVLVDLPGNMDTNAARGAIADAYQKNLTMTCVVAPTSRAASDKPAQELLGKVTQRNLQLDNHFSAKHLCFIVTKTDSSLDVERYIKTHPNVAASLKDSLHREATLKDLRADVIQFIADKNEIEVTEHQNRIKIIKESKKIMASIRKAQKERGVVNNKRKIESPSQETAAKIPTAEETDMTRKYQDLIEIAKGAQERENLAVKLLWMGQGKLKAIEKALWQVSSRKTAACVENRNRVSMSEIKKDFKSVLKQMGQDTSGDRLQVFCVSALAFSEFDKESCAPRSGFRRKIDTGIPALAKWLVGTTLPTRDQNALSLLETLISLELSIKPWIEDSGTEYKMSYEQKEALEAEFKKSFGNLQNYLSTLNNQTSQDIKAMVQSGLLSKLAKVEAQAVVQAERIVRGWAQKPVAWSTHKATNRNFGDWKSSRGVKYAWNDDLAGNFLDLVLQKWTQTLHKKVPALQAGYTKSICNLIEDCVMIIVAFAIKAGPNVSSSLEQWADITKRTHAPLQDHSRNIFDNTIQDVARDAHRLVKPVVLDSWIPVYEQCGAEAGKGLFERNLHAHLDHVRTDSRKMYKNGSRAIQSEFKKLWATLQGEFDAGTESALNDIKEGFELLMDNHTLYGDKATAEETERGAKIQIRLDTLEAFEKLHRAWQIEVEEDVEMPDIEPEEIEITLDDLYNPPTEILDDEDFEDDAAEEDYNNSFHLFVPKKPRH